MARQVGSDAVPEADNANQQKDGVKVVAEEFWDSCWGKQRPRAYKGPPVWHRRVARHLPRRDDWTVFEVGCVPGGFLVYFHKEFGYQLAGLDYVPQLELVQATLAMNGCPPAALVQADFFSYTPEHTYDVVYSGGFIEHFEDYMPAVRNHVKLVRPGGYLLLSVPNFRGAQYLLRSVFDREDLAKHRFEIMKPAVLARAVRSCGMDVLECRPAGTFGFWVFEQGEGVRRILARSYEISLRWVARALDAVGLGDVPSTLFSPQVICIARKPDN